MLNSFKICFGNALRFDPKLLHNCEDADMN